MARAKTPIPVIATLVGWSPTTMWEMANKYAHFYTDDLREAVERIPTPAAHYPFHYPSSAKTTASVC